ncbi:xanthine dehydrogenase family protein subunit M [Solirubrobacter ginsenosidimutans]|uniref:Xanthine dehydrogenase family protein subunit M n=1 Tax=Solirubrobacter ginsenosidimutans TaxID=490573 RepID=A0A9X3S0N2_9ACTN|nr:xanthine dehydrogenase family protein subunit M [Solirubrobacter ginsenosidimutans]MDA0162225.1 xanthine dehydrogenase family protein subunit M [Solirubrobacter ginsenosidimutans]
MQVPAPFGYERATSVEEALALLEEHGPEARLLAGGHSLLPMMKLRLAAPEYVIDIDPLADALGYIQPGPAEVRIGAMTRHNALLESAYLLENLSIFTDAERVIADPVVRNRGTIGGALCQADPSEDLSAVCAAVKAKLVIRGMQAERVVDMHEFHRGPYETAVGPAEMLVEIRVPVSANSGSAYLKVDRRVGDWAVVAAGAALTLGEDGRITQAGLALAAVGGDITVSKAERALIGEPPTQKTFERAARLAQSACEPVSDQRGSADYKRHVVGVLTERVLARATERAQPKKEE